MVSRRNLTPGLMLEPYVADLRAASPDRENFRS
jgi:hypothetical protein